MASKSERVRDRAGQTGIPLLAGRCLVGTFHKTGTALMHKILARLSVTTGAGLWIAAADREEPGRWDICFDWQSEFRAESADPARLPTLVLLRDPRDVLLSSMRYHRTADEHWLTMPRAEWGGQSYRDRINALADDRARLLFELEHTSGRTIARMLAVRADPAHRKTLFVRIEELMEDRSMGLFREIFRHLGIHETHVPRAMRIAGNNALFNAHAHRGGHIGSGKTREWVSELDAVVLERFRERFPDAPRRLGYA